MIIFKILQQVKEMITQLIVSLTIIIKQQALEDDPKRNTAN